MDYSFLGSVVGYPNGPRTQITGLRAQIPFKLKYFAPRTLLFGSFGPLGLSRGNHL